MRRAASYILLAAILAARVAPLHHAHAETAGLPDHHSHPHFHAHGHDHAHPHDHDSAHEHEKPGKHTQFSSQDHSHDDDAIYVDVVNASATQLRDRAEQNNTLALVTAFAASTLSAELPPPTARAEPPPDPLVFGPNLYLRNLSLRI